MLTLITPRNLLRLLLLVGILSHSGLLSAANTSSYASTCSRLRRGLADVENLHSAKTGLTNGDAVDLTTYIIKDAQKLKTLTQEMHNELKSVLGSYNYPGAIKTARLVMNHNALRQAGLTEDEGIIIYLYVTSFYHNINISLRIHDISKVEATILVLASAINKLDRKQVTVKRGTDLPNDIARQMTVGHTFVESGFLSTTAVHPPSSTSWMITDGMSPNFMGMPYIFTIESSNGRDISQFSIYGQAEKEILFPPGSIFKVIDIAKKGGKTYIKLTHEPAPTKRANSTTSLTETKPPFNSSISLGAPYYEVGGLNILVIFDESGHVFIKTGSRAGSGQWAETSNNQIEITF